MTRTCSDLPNHLCLRRCAGIESLNCELDCHRKAQGRALNVLSVWGEVALGSDAKAWGPVLNEVTPGPDLC